MYLDHAATTPLDDKVLEAMMPYFTASFGNASSVHKLGRKARYAVEDSRERIAALLGAEPSEIIFTSGGTEANNTAINGALSTERPHFITSGMEHEAVLNPAHARAEAGMPTTILTPHPNGHITPEQLADAIGPSTGLVSLMHVNNETGVMNDIAALAKVCHEKGVLFHTDAVQSAGLYALRVDALDVDMLSLSGHKFYGPKGVGVLYVRGGTPLRPLLRGGAQERKRRAGTENVAAIVGLTEALDAAYADAETRATTIRRLRDRLHARLTDLLAPGSYHINTPLDGPVGAAPHILHLSFPPIENKAVDGEMLILNLDMEGICASSGSACTSGALSPSHVLLALGQPPETARAAVRFSLGKDTTAEDVDTAASALSRIMERMRLL